MPRKWLLAGGLAALLVVLATIFLLSRRHPPPPPKPAPKPIAQPAPPPPVELSLLGKIQARNVVNVSAPIDGTVERYLVEPGEQVFQAEVIAHIKNASLESSRQAAQVEAARAQTHITDLESQLISTRLEASRARSEAIRAKTEYDRAEKEYRHQQLLFEAGATPRLTFEKSKTDFDHAKSAYETLDTTALRDEDRVPSLTHEIEAAKRDAAAKAQALDKLDVQAAAGEVRSPTDGLVIARHGQAGEQVTLETYDLFQIAVELGALEITVDPDPAMLPRIHAGMPATIQIAEGPAPIDGQIREIKDGHVVIDFTSPSSIVKPGLTAQVKIKLG